MSEHDVVIVGAGPYGLAAAAHLARAGVRAHVVGDPMAFWCSMPEGMLLRSNRTATNIAEPAGALSLDAYEADTATAVGVPVPLQRFVDYGLWVRDRVVGEVDERRVVRLDGGGAGGGFDLTLADGDRLRARRVVLACGIADFEHRPAFAAGLPPGTVTHTGEHASFAPFVGRRVLVVGGGQSALESAALLHENGARAEVAVRSHHVNWLHGGRYQRLLGRAAPLLYAPTDVGPMGLSRLVAAPGLFSALPRAVQGPLAHRAIRPAGAAWLPSRLADVAITFGARVETVTPTSAGALQVGLTGGDIRVVDHLLLGTGYRVDVARYPFLAPGLLARLASVSGYPVLRGAMESSVPGLHVVGAAAAWSFGPTMRFVSGSWFAGRTLAAGIGAAPAARSEREPVA